MIKDEYNYAFQAFGTYTWNGEDKTWRNGTFNSLHGIVSVNQYPRYRRESAAMDPVQIGWVLMLNFIWEGRKYTARLERKEFFTDRSMSVQASKMVDRIVNNK